MERLTKRIGQHVYYTQGKYEDTLPVEMETNNIRSVLKKLAEYEDLEEQGMLLRLPCGYNEDLYWIANGYVQKVWFKGIRCDKGYKPQIIARYIDGSTLNPKEAPITLLENIGKTVFFAKKEAEQALERMKKENGRID